MMKKKKRLILPCLLALLCGGMAHAQSYYATTTVQQNNAVVTADGTANFDIGQNDATMEFIKDEAGNITGAKMTINGVTVAQIPIDDNGGELAGQPGTASSLPASQQEITLSSHGYATFYSPFRTHFSSDVKVYAPTYSGGLVRLNSTTEIEYGDDCIVPVNRVLVLKGGVSGKSTIEFKQDQGTETLLQAQDGFAGSVLKLTSLPAVESGKTLYTMGTCSTDATLYGFFSYSGTTLSPRKAYLIANTNTSNPAKQGFAFSIEDVTGINDVDASVGANARHIDGKFFENGRIIIVKGGRKYYTNGQELK